MAVPVCNQHGCLHAEISLGYDTRMTDLNGFQWRMEFCLQSNNRRYILENTDFSCSLIILFLNANVFIKNGV